MSNYVHLYYCQHFWYTTAFLLYPPICESQFWHLFQTKIKAFRAIAPSSVAFHIQLEQFKITKCTKLRKWKSESESGHLHPKVKVATFTKKYMKNLLWKNLTGSSSSHPPFAPPPLLLPCPKCLLTEAWKASSFGPLVLLLLRWATFITTSE